MSDNNELKRLNFFAGLFTTAEDWTAEQKYHLDKQKQINRVLHRPGVAEGLQVEPHPEGGLNVLVKAGVALDPCGNLIYLAENRKVTVDPSDDANLPIYLRIEFAEQKDAYVANVQDPEYSDYTRLAERPKLIADRDRPSTKQLLLARINIPANATAISPADIDCSIIQTIGAIDQNRDQETAKIWQTLAWVDQDHLKYRLLLNQRLHRPGVLPAERQELKVEAAGGLQVRVLPGAALDGNGNVILLPEARVLEVVPPSVLPATVYITIEYVETPDPTGERRRTGVPRLVSTTETPDACHLELARIDLQPNVQEIKKPEVATNPVGNEIDLRYAARIGAVDSERDQQLAAVQERIKRLHEYRAEQQRRHHRGLHTPGVLHGIPNWRSKLTEFSVWAHQGLTLQVGAGAALDADGNEIYLDEPCQLTLPAPASEKTRYYIAVRHADPFATYLINWAQPWVGHDCTAELTVTTDKPTNSPWLELAHIDLAPGATTIADPSDPANPQPGEIDRRDRLWSGAIGLTPPRLTAALQQRLIQCMQATRQHFALLAERFPTPALEDMRYSALHLQMSAATLEPDQLTSALNALAQVAESSAPELVKVCRALLEENRFLAYQTAIVALRKALSDNLPPENVLDCQQTVAEAALTLSAVQFPPPTADAGEDQTVQTADTVIRVILDASRSRPGVGRKIVKYRWEQV